MSPYSGLYLPKVTYPGRTIRFRRVDHPELLHGYAEHSSVLSQLPLIPPKQRSHKMRQYSFEAGRMSKVDNCHDFMTLLCQE